jgi:hypothetical protein
MQAGLQSAPKYSSFAVGSGGNLEGAGATKCGVCVI